MIKAILFDLDGTLLPMDLNEFTKAYVKKMTEKFALRGYDSLKFYQTIFSGMTAMVKNDGKNSNEAVFFDNFAKSFGVEKTQFSKDIFNEFYCNDYYKLKNHCGFDSNANKTLDFVKRKGYRVVLATNPFFPRIATESRIKWAGLIPDDFEYITTFDNSSYCKPNPKYYLDLLSKIGLAPNECLMVGNDVEEDMVAETVGIKCFLLTNCLINRNNKDVNAYKNGGFEDLIKYIESGL